MGFQMSERSISGISVPIVSCNTVVVGSGAAGLGAAVSLHARGVTDVVIATDSVTGGTSRNAGSDKQTYYTLSLTGAEPDAVAAMAADLAAGGGMHGDLALIEARYSLRAFHRLVELGVPFPRSRFGAHPGYRTDHDPRGRATSAGPLTSRYMTEALAAEADRRGIPLLDRHQVVALVTGGTGDETCVMGALALTSVTGADSTDGGFVLFNAVNVILATGGPGGMYAHSVYPESQIGSTGLALRAGARAVNLTESQFGLASLTPRWNLSGSYQQVIPRYLSTDAGGGEEREFLSEVFPDAGRLALAIFRKGYEWPFDPRKVAGYGSSLIDLLVDRERRERGRRVFLDYTANPGGGERYPSLDPDRLPGEARTYLANSDALAATPIERLERLNPPAVRFFRDHGVDLGRGRLEIAVCAQHCNGGLEGNLWWDSNLRHLFPVGEVNGSHGIYRPGGAALNAGQVGGMRAAEYIAARYAGAPPDEDEFLAAAAPVLEENSTFLQRALELGGGAGLDPAGVIEAIGARMSEAAAQVRDPGTVRRALGVARELHERLPGEIGLAAPAEAPALFRARDLTCTHRLWLEAIAAYLERGGGSRGSYLVPDPAGIEVCPELGPPGRIRMNDPGAFVDAHLLTLTLAPTGEVVTAWVEPRPVPSEDLWFERVWTEFREGWIFD